MCNAIQGTDGSTFHPDIKKDETIHIFNRDLCRSLPLVYQKDVIDGNGIPGYRFVILTLLGLGLIKINTVLANFNNPRPSLILNN